MNSIAAGSRTAAVLPSERHPEDAKRIADAARQFESLLIAQLLKSMRESGGGWLGTGDDQAGAQAMELAEEQMARALAQQGGLGLAQLVVAGLKRESPAPADGDRSHDQKLQP
jgi:Rod binding domain-containing protein